MKLAILIVSISIISSESEMVIDFVIKNGDGYDLYDDVIRAHNGYENIQVPVALIIDGIETEPYLLNITVEDATNHLGTQLAYDGFNSCIFNEASYDSTTSEYFIDLSEEDNSKKMWKWIKKLFRPWNLTKVSPDIKSVKPKVDLTCLTKGDIKKLKGQGKI